MKEAWVYEKFPLKKPTSQVGLLIKKKLFKKSSPYQQIEVVDTYECGRVLIIDSIFQTSAKDEFIYHEMMAHLPLCFHPFPKNILIIGGGDGGVLREVLKHPIKEVCLVEIDKMVLEVAQRFLPIIHQKAFQDKRVKIFIDDGAKFIKNFSNFFDVIIIDSSDPFGPSEILFSQKFYQDVSKALTKFGLMMTQSGGIFFQVQDIKKTQRHLEKVFPYTGLALAAIPLYHGDIYSFSLGSKINLTNFSFSKLNKRFKQLNLKTKYYDPVIHQNSFYLPKFLKDNLSKL